MLDKKAYLCPRNVPVMDDNSKDMEKQVFIVNGMKCCHCEMNVENAVKSIAGVASADADREEGKVTVEYDAAKVSADDIKSAVENVGNYEVVI